MNTAVVSANMILIEAVRNLFRTASQDCELSDLLKVNEVNERQGCFLSPLLHIILMDKIIKKANLQVNVV